MDGLTLPRAEFVTIVEDEEEEKELLLDSYTIPWDMAIQVIDMTATADTRPRATKTERPTPTLPKNQTHLIRRSNSDEEP